MRVLQTLRSASPGAKASPQYIVTLNKHSLPRLREGLKIPRPYSIIGEESQDLFKAAYNAIETAGLSLTCPGGSQTHGRLERLLQHHLPMVAKSGYLTRRRYAAAVSEPLTAKIVFPNKTGNPMDWNTTGRNYKSLREAAGLPGDYPLLQAAAHFRTLVLEQGETPQIVGHYQIMHTRRSAFQDMAAEGLVTFDELRAKLATLEETCEMARRELEVLSRRQETIEELEQDRDALLDSYAGLVPEALEALTSEERHRVYKTLQLQVMLRPDSPPEVSGSFSDRMSVSELETAGSRRTS